MSLDHARHRAGGGLSPARLRLVLALLFPPSLGRIGASARADLLGKWMARQFGVEVEIDVAPTYEALQEAIATQAVDLAWAPPIICAAVQPQALSILKAVRGGRSMYRAALVTRPGEFTTLAELEGREVAWVDRLSTAGYLLPSAHLHKQGHDPERFFARQHYVGSYGRALRAVADREADLAAIYVHDATDEAAAGSIRELMGPNLQLQPIAFTDEVPTDGLVVVDRGPNSDVHRVLELLRSLSDGHTHTMLLTIFDAEALEPAQSTDYDPLRAALEHAR